MISLTLYLEAHGEEFPIDVARLKEADLVDRFPFLIEIGKAPGS
jgi:hypothetical protein